MEEKKKMTKITKKQIEEIREKYKQGVKVYKLAEEYNLSAATIYYWANDEINKKRKEESKKYYANLSQSRKKEIYNNKKEYIKDYMRNRYQRDKEFRKKHIERVKDYNKRKKNVRE